MAGEARRLIIRCAVAPDGVLRALLAAVDFDRPIRAIALERAISVVLARPHQREPHVLFRDVMHRLVAGLLATHRVRRIGDDLAGEGDAHAAGLGQQTDAMVGLCLIAGGGGWRGWAPLFRESCRRGAA